MGAKTNKVMLRVAEGQLEKSFENVREEHPKEVVARTSHTRHLFAVMNEGFNASLQEFWRRQVSKYEERGKG